jgi:hypothetical protein
MNCRKCNWSETKQNKIETCPNCGTSSSAELEFSFFDDGSLPKAKPPLKEMPKSEIKVTSKVEVENEPFPVE